MLARFGVERVVRAWAGRKTACASASEAPQNQKSAAAEEVVIFGCFVLALAWLPLLNGSNSLAGWGINAVLFAAIAASYETWVLFSGRPHPFGMRAVGLPACLFALTAAAICAQTLAWPSSPLAHPIWGMAADALGRPLAAAISVDPDLTELALLRLVTAALVFWTALQLCRDGVLAKRLLVCLAAIGSAYAGYGLIALGMPALRLSWAADALAAGTVSSTFVNRNSFADYAGLGLVTVGALGLQLYRREVTPKAANRRLAIAAMIELAGRDGAPVIAAGIVMAAALLLSGSRGGTAAAGLGLFVLAVLMPRAGGKRALSPAVLTMLVCAAAAGLLLVFGDPVVARFREDGLEDASRASVYLLTLRSIADRPLLGHGYGTFGDVFAMYRDRSISANGFWQQAHDTYLEIFQGLGLVFGSMLIGAVLLLVWRCIAGAGARRDNAAVPAAAAAAAALVGVHSFVDFGLQIQAVALSFAAMLGAGVAQAESSRAALHD